MNKVIDKLPALVAEELAAMNAVHPPFASLHEGYAVTLEEVDEANEERLLLESVVDALWEAVKYDDVKDALKRAATIESIAIKLTAEAIQIAACARKMRESLGGGEDD